MITLYNKDFTINYGTINTTIEAFVEEERNGLFELSFIMLNTDNLFDYIKEENIVVTNANDTLLNQKFRIYMTRKLMNNRVEVFARHISFDLMYDYIDNLSFTNQSCQYALNQLFINSNFSKHYKGYSDIVNAQNYSMSTANVLEAIGGKKGSIIDTYGTGAELLRDNENIHVLNKRGHDNSVTIEYRKNLTGFELEEDTTDLVTRILPYAKYNPTDEEGNTLDEVTVKANFVDSPLINNYSHPYIRSIDYSEKFEDDEIPTVEKLINYAKREFNINKVDQPKQNFKIDFIPLSKCVGYDGLEDKISLCDTVTIIDTRYNINTQAKVIKTVFNVLKNRYESIELGEPKTSLGDIIGSGGDNEPVVGPPGPPGPPGADGNLGDFPNSLPAIPILQSFVYGFSNIELTWSFENKIYYQYELYASKVKDFNPNTFDLIFQGQASSYMFQAKPNETWYFKVCAINTYGERTEFSNQATVTTTKIEDLSNYVENMAINEALIGTLSLDRGWIGRLNANLLDVKGNFSVTDGNGKRTLDIDSFGNVNLDVTSLKISSKNAATQDYTNNLVTNAKNEVIEDTKTYTDTQINLVNGEILLKASKTEVSNAKDEAINTSNKYTDSAKDEAINTSNEYTDSAKDEAISITKTYTDTQINVTNEQILLKASKTELSETTKKVTDDAKKYTDNAKSEAIDSANSYADNIKDQAIDSANSYTDNVKGEVIETSKKYTDAQILLTNEQISLKASKTELLSTKNEVINSANSYTDKAKEEAIEGANDYTDSVKEEAINTSNNYTNEVKKELSASIEVTAESITNKVNGLDNKYTEIKQTVDGIDLTGKVSFSDLSTSGKTTIVGDNITSGTIKGIKIVSTSTEDQTRCVLWSDGMRFYSPTTQAGRICFDSNGEGTESSATDRFLIESWNNYAMKLLSTGDMSLTAKNYNGYNDIFLEANKVRLNNKLLVDGATEFYSTLYASGNITSDGTIKCARVETTGDIVGSNNIYAKGNKLVYHTGNKPTASDVGALSISGGTISGALTASGTIKGNRLEANGDVVCNSVWASNKVYANNVALTSDRNLKTGIKYINKDIQSIDKNGLMNPNTNITTDDMHEFIETLPMASYRLKSDVENEEDYTHYGFIAQDILYTKVGSELIHIIPKEKRAKDEDGNIIEDGLRYSVDKLVSFLCGALQKEIELRKKLEKRVANLENEMLKEGV